MPSRQTKVVYGHLETEVVGEIWFAESERGIWCIQSGTSQGRFLESLHRDGVSAAPNARQTAATRRELAEYFEGKRRKFTRKLDWSRRTGFVRRALQVCAKIPYGKTMSYGELARRAGSPGGARAVGHAMGRNPFAIMVPAHRVVKSDGSMGSFGNGYDHKRALLELEGVTFSSGRAVRPPRGLPIRGFRI
jgi:O-6-methylguanine DNA methyltransferase